MKEKIKKITIEIFLWSTKAIKKVHKWKKKSSKHFGNFNPGPQRWSKSPQRKMTSSKHFGNFSPDPQGDQKVLYVKNDRKRIKIHIFEIYTCPLPKWTKKFSQEKKKENVEKNISKFLLFFGIKHNNKIQYHKF
jgi:hypothetical protein